MAEDKGPKKSGTDSVPAANQISAPTISLPKGGGAIRGMGEKFAANPVTGTGSMSVPIATSPGRSGFGPQLSLSYDSGAGNGPFGLGWSLSLPSITRKTDKGLPQYLDSADSDVFILSGAEDLVPTLVLQGTQWVREVLPPRTVRTKTYNIQRYRPRIEGLFARIERWTDAQGVSHWRSISKDNITTLYGSTDESRIVDPSDEMRIFSWLICESYDDKGNAILYEYKKENSQGIDRSSANEANRQDTLRTANRYLKRIKYGNKTPRQAGEDLSARNDWMFEAVFDYGEHYIENGTTADDQSQPTTVRIEDTGQPEWATRQDSFSSYRAGFEVRTYRLCRRVLMFHHFDELKDIDYPGGENYLVRATHFAYNETTVASFITGVTQSGYKRIDGIYRKKSLPPVEFTYSQAIIQEEVHEVDPASLENLPQGLDNSRYQWADLDGEGLSGILTEQGGAWFYKRNQSAVSVKDPAGKETTVARFAPLERVATMPSSANLSGGQQLMDLAGNGQLDVVDFEGPTPGFFERTLDEEWETHKPFTSLPNIAWRDANLKFIDLTGDGHADILITEDQAFSWYPSLAEAGFGPGENVRQAIDEEQGPRLVFADGTQSIYLADMSGDGLTDLVRIRNGQVCYWPNLGYGRFGAKVTMDYAPVTDHASDMSSGLHFDHPDQFDHKRIRLADIDGSGTTDIIYLHRDGVRLYFNQSGNGWSEPRILLVFPRVDDIVSIVATDLLGNGTACLVWSSPLPGDARRQMRYVDLMGGQKPHLLVKTVNNLGAETSVQYASSIKFYLQDKRDGNLWITKLPFPVHVVEKVTVTDNWRKTSFSSTYSYHHGYFDGTEREFRGFGRVEQVDVESYGKFEQGNAASPYITDNHDLYQPPVKTVTWYHTGAFLDRERILSAFKQEYVPVPGFTEHQLPEPTLTPANLSNEEWREALRACKGMVLRQEVFELDVDALDKGTEVRVRLFSTAYHNSNITRVQPQGINRHAVFLVTESEAITYNYELDLRQTPPKPDPRIAHTLNVKFDAYGRALQSVAVVYPRLVPYVDPANTLTAEQLTLISNVQKERHIAYTETHYTDELLEDPHQHRLPAPCEVLTYELTGANSTKGFVPSAGLYFSLDDLKAFVLSETLPDQGTKPVAKLAYHEQPTDDRAHKRIVEWVRMLYFKDDLSDAEPFRTYAWLGLPYETYKLALTEALLDAVFKDAAGNNKLDQVVDGMTTAHAKLNDPAIGGYLSGAKLTTRFASIPATELTGQYWIRSGITGFANNAAQHFYLPEKYTDPFDNVTMLEYDSRDLFVASSTDMLQNKTEVTRFDYRVLAPCEMKDINNNLSEVYFDVLGLPTAMAVKGKGTEGDNLRGFTDALANPERTKLTAFFVEKPYDAAQAQDWLGNATARHVYYFGETIKDGKITWATHPACACGILRERHVSQLGPGEKSLLHAAFEYSDGMGSVVVKKVQAEPDKPGQPMRWVANGKTILNNKGKPVKQYEPYFSPPEVGHRFEEPREEGVTPVMYYDAPGRLVRTDMPDGSFSRVEFSPWHVCTFDQNDTAYDPDPINPDHSDWFKRRTDSTHPLFAQFNTAENRRVAELVKAHANTPSLTILDSLGRDVISIVHNRVKDAAGALKDEKYLTFTKLDAEGKPLWIRDARKNLVMQYISPPVPNNQAADPVAGFVPCYDIAGNLLFQHSMDAGDRWMINDAVGKPMLAWNSRGHTFRTDYDKLHRPGGSFVKGADPADRNRLIQFEKIIYGDTPGNGLSDSPTNDQTRTLNLRGKPYRHYETAGLVTSMGRNPTTNKDEAFDFKGNLLRSTRQLVKDYKNTPDWSQNQTPALETEIFTSSTSYDALNRPIQLVAPHSNQAGTTFNIIRPGYNEANLLERVDVWLNWVDPGPNHLSEPDGLLDPKNQLPSPAGVANIDYDAKGQRQRIDYKNGTSTFYDYDRLTFRLAHLYTRRGVAFTDDCDNTHPPPPTIAAPDTPPQGKACGLQNLHYTYDPAGNITYIRDDAQQTVFFNNSTIEPSNVYTYDALYRLIRAEGREHAVQNNIQRDAKKFEPIIGIPFPNSPEALQRYTEEYAYDPVGNILGVHHTGGTVERWVRWYQYPLDSNRLLATRLPGDQNKLPDYAATPGYTGKYSYDAHGNMTTMPHLPTMEWDFKDQLRASQQQRVSNGGTGEKTYYIYDAAGQRVRKITELANGNLKDERMYLGDFEIYRQHSGADAGLVRESLHIMDDKQRIALVETRTDTPTSEQLIRYQFGNHLGSASLELDKQAQVISYEEYHPYGTTAYEAARSQTETAKRYRYTGKERDEETGFNYHGARYEAVWLGRWVSCDPAGTVDGPSLYQALRGNPVRLMDPSGLQSVGQVIEDKALQAIKEDRYVSGYLWSFADVAWSVFGAEGVSKVAAGNASTGDYVSAGIEVASVIPIGKLAKGAKALFGVKGAAKELAPVVAKQVTETAGEALAKEVAKEGAPAAAKEVAPALAKEVAPGAAKEAGGTAAELAGKSAAETQDKLFRAAKEALKKAEESKVAPVAASTLGSVGKVSSPSGFRNAVARAVAKDKNHPLKFLLNAKDKLKSGVGKSAEVWAEMPEMVEAGHAVSKKALTGAAAGTDRFMVMSVWHNRMISGTIEHSSKQGAYVAMDYALEIGGIPVHASTAYDWVAKGLLAPEVFAAARKVVF